MHQITPRRLQSLLNAEISLPRIRQEACEDAAHHRVFNLSILQKVLLELLITDFALQAAELYNTLPGLWDMFDTVKRQLDYGTGQGLTVPPTNIFRVRVGEFPEFLGTAAFASIFLPSM